MNIAREIFEQFKTEIQDKIANNALLAEYGEEKAEGRIDAFNSAINILDEITRGKTLSVCQENKINEKGYNNAIKDVEELLVSKKSGDCKKMTIRQKCSGKRYCVFAKRRNGNEWTVWTDTDDLNKAMKQVAKVRELGFLGKVTDRKKRKIITSD
jgi:hypothetical protein